MISHTWPEGSVSRASERAQAQVQAHAVALWHIMIYLFYFRWIQFSKMWWVFLSCGDEREGSMIAIFVYHELVLTLLDVSQGYS